MKELTAYRSAEQELISTDRVYCADSACVKFVPLLQQTPDCAFCDACSAETCMHCRALAHKGGCTADEARQSLMISRMSKAGNSVLDAVKWSFGMRAVII